MRLLMYQLCGVFCQFIEFRKLPLPSCFAAIVVRGQGHHNSGDNNGHRVTGLCYGLNDGVMAGMKNI